MIHQTGTFTGGGDTGLFYQGWVPADPRATLVIVHGYGEHSGRYAHVAAVLNERGYAVWALDHRGHGRSEGVRAHVDRFSHFIDDLATFVEVVRGKQPTGPLFMLGHSMGGLIATHYAFKHQDKLAGLVLSGPAYKIDGGTPQMLITLSRLVSALSPRMAVGPFDVGLISRDPAVVQAAKDDPLVYHGKVRARLGREMLVASWAVPEQAPTLTLPILLVQGEADKIADPAGARMVFERFGSADKTLKLFSSCYHELVWEPEQDEVIGLIGDWLDQHHPVAATSAPA